MMDTALKLSGKSVSFEEFQDLLDPVKEQCQLHADLLSDLNESRHQTVRSTRGAVVFLGTCASELVDKAMALAGDPTTIPAANIVAEVALVASDYFKAHKDRHQELAASDNPEPLAEATIEDKCENLSARLVELLARSQHFSELTSNLEGGGHPAVAALQTITRYLIDGVAEGLSLARGGFEPKWTDTQILETLQKIFDEMKEYFGNEKQAAAVLAEEYAGVSMSDSIGEKRAALTHASRIQLAVGSLGTRWAGAMMGEQEGFLADIVMDRLEQFLSTL